MLRQCWRGADDGQQVVLGRRREVGEPIHVGEQLELAGAVADLDAVGGAGRLHVVLDERDGPMERVLVHLSSATAAARRGPRTGAGGATSAAPAAS
jgi:hypothetical protein